MARTQEQRSAATRAALLDATIDCLIDYGYAGTTTTRVAERAGVSRGAQMHHFQRKAPLVVAALLRLAERRRRELLDRAERELPEHADPAAALDLLWSTFSGPLFTAALELWMAARTDPELAEHLLPAEREIGRGARETARRLCSGEDLDLALELAANAMRGIALQQLLNPSPSRCERQLDFLKQTISTHLTPERQTA
jgi:AcrR family transcriptional regulator